MQKTLSLLAAFFAVLFLREKQKNTFVSPTFFFLPGPSIMKSQSSVKVFQVYPEVIRNYNNIHTCNHNRNNNNNNINNNNNNNNNYNTYNNLF